MKVDFLCRVLVDILTDLLLHFDFHAQFFLDFALERALWSLARFDLSSRKLPRPRATLTGTAAKDQHRPLLIKNGCHDMNFRVLFSSQKRSPRQGQTKVYAAFLRDSKKIVTS